VVVIHVDHGDLRIRQSEEALREPHTISLEVKLLHLFLHLGRKRRIVLVVRVANVQPLVKELAFARYAVVVKLVTTADHGVEGLRLMRVQHIPPHGVRAAELVGLGAEAEAVAAVEHDVHGLSARWDPEPHAGSSVDAVGDPLLLGLELHLDVEAPEGMSALGVQAEAPNILVLL